jgi:hypothetical protein
MSHRAEALRRPRPFRLARTSPGVWATRTLGLTQLTTLASPLRLLIRLLPIGSILSIP